MDNIIENLQVQLENANLKIQALQSALDKEKEAHLQTQAKLPRIERGLNKANQFIYDMKIALANADNTYQGAADLFSSILAPAFPTKSAQTLAELYNAQKSYSQMAGMVLGDTTKKSTIHRMVKDAMRTHPELFIKR